MDLVPPGIRLVTGIAAVLPERDRRGVWRSLSGWHVPPSARKPNAELRSGTMVVACISALPGFLPERTP
jgi:hypothetical protein